MASTARVTILFEEAEKAALQSRARAAHTSTGEYIKRAVTAYDADTTPDAQTIAELEAMADLLDAATKQMGAQLDASIAKLDRYLDPAREAAQRDRIEREVRAMDLNGVTAMLGLSA